MTNPVAAGYGPRRKAGGLFVVTDQQVRKLMDTHAKTGLVGRAADKAGMDRKTARKYLKQGKMPSQMRAPRAWRTREDPFTADWPRVVEMLEDAPELEAKALFEYLLSISASGAYEPGQLRSFQRRVHTWRAAEGPEKEIFFAQCHVPGEAMQTDFTWTTELGITVAGEPFPHMLCHVVLPYSNWSAVTICGSESISALRDGIQNAVFRLGRVPRFNQTDNSTAATHAIGDGKRSFNVEYVDILAHLGIEPRTIRVGESEQNGDVEALNGALKRRLKQHLLLRGSEDFDTLQDYRNWLRRVLDAANALRGTRLEEELAAMRPLVASRLADFTTEDVVVSSWSTIRVHHNAYSLPSRLIGETVAVRIFEDRLEVWFADTLQAQMERLRGRNGHRIDYRHVIFWLVRKPGAFRRYRYREDLFPTLNFRKAYDRLVASRVETKADLEYLRVLNLAATTSEHDVDTALALLLESGELPLIAAVRELAVAPALREAHDLEPYTPDLMAYDAIAGLGGGR
jgi:transposase